MRSTPLVALLALLCAPARADNRPDAPTPKVESTRIEHAPISHKFYNREARITLAIESAAWAGDMAMTCQNLSHNGHEWGLPSQNCGAIIGMTFGFHAAAEGTAYLLHRLHLYQLERFPRWYVTASNIYGLSFSTAHSNGHTQ